MTPNLDTRPRRAWLRPGVPGAQMMEVLKSHDSALRRRRLRSIYGDEAWVALQSAALALHLMPRHAARHGMPYADVLADIRDFVRFRFRIKGLIGLNETIDEAEEHPAPGPDVQDIAIVEYVVGRLGALARQSLVVEATRMTELLNSIRGCRDLLRTVARRLPRRDDEQFTSIESLFAGPGGS